MKKIMIRIVFLSISCESGADRKMSFEKLVATTGATIGGHKLHSDSFTSK